MKLYDVASWLGVVAILLAYALISFEIIDATYWGYSALNLFGAISLVWSSYIKKDYQPVALNVVWGVIAVIGLTMALL